MGSWLAGRPQTLVAGREAAAHLVHVGVQVVDNLPAAGLPACDVGQEFQARGCLRAQRAQQQGQSSTAQAGCAIC